MSRSQRIFIAGHRGMVGSALLRRLQSEDAVELLTQGRDQLDLTRQNAVHEYFSSTRIDQVYLAAARVGGIHANQQYPADFISDNLSIQNNVINAAHEFGVDRLLFLGSSCIYPREAEQPMTESALMTGPLEKTNEAYAVAKIAGIKACEAFHRQHGCDFRSVMPTNLYGPHDNFDLMSSHVLPALLRKFHEAAKAGDSEVTVWGTGRPRREFLHVDDLADACVHLMGLDRETYWEAVDDHCSHINIGFGEDISIADLAALIAQICGFNGAIRYDKNMPDGTPRKWLDVTRATRLGWTASTGLEEGIRSTYQWMLEHSQFSR